MVSKPIMATKEIVEAVQKHIQKYDEEDEYHLASNDGPNTLICLVQLTDNIFYEWAETLLN